MYQLRGRRQVTAQLQILKPSLPPAVVSFILLPLSSQQATVDHLFSPHPHQALTEITHLDHSRRPSSETLLISS